MQTPNPNSIVIITLASISLLACDNTNTSITDAEKTHSTKQQARQQTQQHPLEFHAESVTPTNCIAHISQSNGDVTPFLNQPAHIKAFAEAYKALYFGHLSNAKNAFN